MDLSNEQIIHVKKDGIEYLQFRRLLEYKDKIYHAYSVGLDKNFRTIGVAEEQYIESYKQLVEELGSSYKNIIKPVQTHSGNVQKINQKVNKDNPDINLKENNEVDGLITDKENITLATTNADCILMMFYDYKKQIIGNVHSGWRGTLQRISTKCIEMMKKEYNSNPEDIICAITPTIRKCHFEVEKDVKELFEKEFKYEIQSYKDSKEKLIEEKIKDKKWNIDAVEFNKIILKNVGLLEKNILDSNICSVCNSDIIHSYRAEKVNYGLHTAVIGKIKKGE